MLKQFLPYLTLFLLFGCSHPDTIVIDSDNNNLPWLHDDYIEIGKLSRREILYGNSSVLTSPENQFGLTYISSQFNPGDIVTASIFRSADNSQVRFVADGNWENHYEEALVKKDKIDNWELLVIRFKIPKNAIDPQIKFYASNYSEDTCHIDHLRINVTQPSDTTTVCSPLFNSLLFDLVNHIHLTTYNEATEEDIKQLLDESDGQSILKSHKITKQEFYNTFKKEVESHQFEGLMLSLKAYKLRNSQAIVTFDHHDEMDVRTPAGWLDSYHVLPKDTINLHLDHPDSCKHITLNKLTGPYTSSPISDLNIDTLTQSLYSISTPQLTNGLYSVALIGKADTFEIPVLVADTTRKSTIILAPVTTWHAYNSYQGTSLYYNDIDESNIYFAETTKPLTSLHFKPNFLGHDFYILNNIYQWFNNYASTNIYPDYYLEKHPELFDSCSTVVIAHHAEYFSSKMFQQLEQMNANKNIISLGGNQLYWKVKWNTDYTKLECRKDQTFFENTSIPGGLWRNQLTSEAKLIGVAYTDAGYTTYSPYKVMEPNHWLFSGLAVDTATLFGSAGIDGRGISGDEMDKTNSSTPENAELIAKGINPENGGGEIVYINKGDLGTLSTGAIASGAGLGKDQIFSTLIENFMNRHHKKRATPKR